MNLRWFIIFFFFPVISRQFNFPGPKDSGTSSASSSTIADRCFCEVIYEIQNYLTLWLNWVFISSVEGKCGRVWMQCRFCRQIQQLQDLPTDETPPLQELLPLLQSKFEEILSFLGGWRGLRAQVMRRRILPSRKDASWNIWFPPKHILWTSQWTKTDRRNVCQ